MSATRLRLFFALWPCAQLAASMHALARRLLEDTGARLIKPESLHMTLAFLGARRAEELDLIRACAEAVEAPAFELMMGRTGSFRRSRVAWLAPLGPPAPLLALERALKTALERGGITINQEVFRPHVTLARGTGRLPPAGAESAPLRWQVNHFRLVRSETLASGARYKEIGRWPLPV